VTGMDSAEFDAVNDQFSITLPSGITDGTLFVATSLGCLAYGITLSAGTYNFDLLGFSGGAYYFSGKLYGSAMFASVLTAPQIASLSAYYVARGAIDDFGSVTSMINFWRGRSWMRSFPLINTAAATNLNATWANCTNLTSFPLINTASCTNLSSAWETCSGLAIFPLINTGVATNLAYAWYSCASLTSFPLINTAACTNFQSAWQLCSGLTSFPLINTAAGTNLDATWKECTDLANFPANAFDACPATNYSSAFLNCGLTQTSVNNILVSINVAGQSGGTLGINGGTSAAPSGAGITAKDALIARGWTVTTN